VLHQDELVLAVDKPAGRLVIPGRTGPDGSSLAEELSARFGRLFVVHRLDRGTSGVLVFARTAAAHRALNQAFEAGQVEKRYLALVEGTPPGELRLELALASGRKGRVRPARPGEPGAKASVTVVRLLETFPARPWGGRSLSLVEALPRTGRTHQIRVHLAHAGHALAVDPDYGAADPLLGPGGLPLLTRTPLHAEALELPHPGGARLTLRAPLPADLSAALEALRRG
jgi:tRNA pseudouridine32 synthase/23S rRNA pseudouridine746 synthase